MKKLITGLFFGFLICNQALAQCGDSEICNSNTGLYSNDDAASIAYDNMGSGFHSTFIKEPNGSWRLWGEYLANNGSHAYSPTSFTVANYPALTGTIYKMGLGSNYASTVQLVVLTSTGLFVQGVTNTVVPSSIASGYALQKITVNGNPNGLPVGITPQDVKMLFVTYQSIIITTCTGEVFVLSQSPGMRGLGTSTGSATQWSKVMQNAAQPLSNVIVARGCAEMGYALKSDGTLWTWGDNAYLGNGSAVATLYYANQMTLPAGMPGIKSIQATTNGTSPSYYILGTDKKVYSLGGNARGQLGDRTNVNRLSWVNAKNPDTSIITDAAWISSNEHDSNFAGIAVIKTGGILYTAGTNDTYMIGRTSDGGTNYLDLPTGIFNTDVITYAETGGHTCALIKQGSPRYGYVGHRINGSMGNGTTTSGVESTYDFITPPIVAVCGTLCAQPVLTSNASICMGQNAVFTITGTPGDIVSYKINNGTTQTAVIQPSGSVQVTVTSPVTDQTISLIYVLGGTGSCSNILSTTATILVSNSTTPLFTQVSSICQGQTLNPLPTISNNGISGTWTPSINNLATTTYNFTPTVVTCGVPVTMTIVVTPTGTTPTFTQIAAICEGDALSALPTNSLEGIDGAWTPALNPNSTTTYTFTPTVGNCLNTAQMTIEVLPKTTTVFTQVAPVCINTAGSPLPAISDNGVVGSWSPAFNNQQTATYTFTPNTGLCATSTSMTVIVNQVINPVFTAVAPICEGEIVAPLPTVSNNAVLGAWSPAINNLATTTYSFNPNAGSCSTTAQMTVVVNPKITPAFTAFSTLCYGDTNYSLPLVSNNGVYGTWSPAIDNTHAATYTFTPNTGECAKVISLPLKVYNDFDFDYVSYCKDNNFYLEVVPVNQSFNLPTASVNWEQDNTSIGNAAILNVTAYLNSTPTEEQLPISLVVKVTDSNGCEKSKPMSINNIFCGVQKGISANNDNLNDFFDLTLLKVRQLKIFNRYGVMVYDKANYINEWKGQSNKGDDLPDGVYYYVIDFKNPDTVTKTGWIYINKEN